MIFEEKFLLCFIAWPNFIVWLLLLREILANMYIVIVCKPGCDVINFEDNFIFLMKPFFLHDQKSQDKKLNILHRAFEMK